MRASLATLLAACATGLRVPAVPSQSPTVSRIQPPIMAADDVALPTPSVAIEYCTRCNWMLRSAWLAQELLTTFNGTLAACTLVPNHDGDGTFSVTTTTAAALEPQLVWSRSAEGRFPESKELKQRVRDVLVPGRSLGHSDSERKA